MNEPTLKVWDGTQWTLHPAEKMLRQNKILLIAVLFNSVMVLALILVLIFQ